MIEKLLAKKLAKLAGIWCGMNFVAQIECVDLTIGSDYTCTAYTYRQVSDAE